MMNQGGAVRRILVVGTDGQAKVLYEKETAKRKKGSRGLRPIEKALRKRAEADKKNIEAYLDAHNRSNEKRRDGWLRDLVVNVVRANQKAVKVLRQG